jgi:DNA-binding NtrC family response regulator
MPTPSCCDRLTLRVVLLISKRMVHRRFNEGRADRLAVSVMIAPLRLNLVKQIRAANRRVPIILMTAHGTAELAIEATRWGAYDYLLKPFEMPALLAMIENAVARYSAGDEPSEHLDEQTPSPLLIGNSRPMRVIYKEIGRVAATPTSVLIRGESGTGKELVGCAIWQHSKRASKPFVAVNCTAIPETLVESEMFGHERGAFTGANMRRIGRFERAHGGTISTRDLVPVLDIDRTRFGQGYRYIGLALTNFRFKTSFWKDFD